MDPSGQKLFSWNLGFNGEVSEEVRCFTLRDLRYVYSKMLSLLEAPSRQEEMKSNEFMCTQYPKPCVYTSKSIVYACIRTYQSIVYLCIHTPERWASVNVYTYSRALCLHVYALPRVCISTHTPEHCVCLCVYTHTHIPKHYICMCVYTYQIIKEYMCICTHTRALHMCMYTQQIVV